MRKYESEALRVLFVALNGLPLPGPLRSVSVSDLAAVVRHARGIHGPSLVLIDALRHGDRAEVEERTADLAAALERLSP